jgi:SAM-dependent methyltransferase
MTALSDDVRGHREWLLGLLELPSAGVVVDLGCGRGDDLRRLATRHLDGDVRLIGLDASAESIEAARAAATDPRLDFACVDLGQRLPFADGSIDVVYSHNLLECLGDPCTFASEVARVLRPHGQAVIGHWDWDSQLFDATDRALVRRLVHAYADWQQAWMDHADGWMGRRLWGVFNAAERFRGVVHARVLVNTTYAAPWFGHANAQAFRALVRRGLADADDVERFAHEQAELDRRGAYFYSITGFAFVGRRIEADR